MTDADKARWLGFLTFLAITAAVLGPIVLVSRCGA